MFGSIGHNTRRQSTDASFDRTEAEIPFPNQVNDNCAMHFGKSLASQKCIQH